ncbi:YihY/virulence factor BrkB family protein [Rudaeicoccus suwonensis]|uniref:YihY family inner membrane protein n=1 Tax=Rudaeicoccus suwonensis TaxID=657409 RepID=A0A561DWU6_9MICO|nr:YihY/virulence factor BrkB family protein [Rudaeicoccus suwonensis]TWE07833.1 YihY family inner membrane protein [Rudaeicoccus suwonensis]
MTLLQLLDDDVERPAEDVPDAPAKPDWKVALKRATGKFSSDQCTTKAAALTYYSLQSLFPGLIALLSLINIFGNGKQTTNSIITIVANIMGKPENDSLIVNIRSFIDSVNTTGGGGIALAVGILGALWSASGYVNGFGQALNQIYEIQEGRPTWRRKPFFLFVTFVDMVLIIIAMFALVTTGKVASSIAAQVGIPSRAVDIWDIAKWPFVVAIVVLIIGLLYWTTPNVRKSARSLASWGAFIGFVVWVVASFALVTYFGLTKGASYQKTYGAMAGAVMFMLWLYVTNIAMLFGAEVDAELLRTRQLKSGLPAEELILLPPKDSGNFAKKQVKAAELYDAAHELRLQALRQAAGPEAAATYGRPARAAGHAALVRGGRDNDPDAVADGQVALVGPRDATTPRPGGSALLTSHDRKAGRTVTYDPQTDEAAIEEARLRRRDAALLEATQKRKVRDRLDRQEAKVRKEQQEREHKAEQARKEAEEHLTRQERWDAVERMRAQYDPPVSAERDAVTAERAERRSRFHAMLSRKSDKTAAATTSGTRAGAGKSVSEHAAADVSASSAVRPQPSALSQEIAAEQKRRRDAWYAARRR